MVSHLDDLTTWSGLHPQDIPLVETYRRHLRTRRYAHKTILACLRAVWRFLKTQAENSPVRLTQITSRHIDRYLETCQDQGLSPRTINHYLVLLSKCFSFLVDQGQLSSNPIHPPKHRLMMPRLLPKPMASRHVQGFFSHISRPDDRAMFLLMLRCGLRVGEVARLRLEAFDFEHHTVRIDDGKGGIDRVGYLSQDVEAALQAWLSLRDEHILWMFYSQRSFYENRPISVRMIQRRMELLLQKAGLSHLGYSPHTLRHTFATQLVQAGIGLLTLQELMRHRNLAQTLQYVRLYEEDKRNDYHQAMNKIQAQHPLERNSR